MIIVLENGDDGQSSKTLTKLFAFHNVETLGWGINPTILPPTMNK